MIGETEDVINNNKEKTATMTDENTIGKFNSVFSLSTQGSATLQKTFRARSVKSTSDDEEYSSESEENMDYWHKYSRRFFDNLIKAYIPETQLAVERNQLAIIAVVHVVPTLPDYLKSLTKLGRVRKIIYKGEPDSKNRDKETIQWVNDKWRTWIKGKFPDLGDYSVEIISDIQGKSVRDGLKTKGFSLVKKWIAEDIKEEKCIILDIGGYFASFLKESSLDEQVKNKLIGIVEDTENGHQAYLSALNQVNDKNASDKLPLSLIPVYSVARAKLKSTEDYNVGKSLVQATDTMLRTEFNLRLQDFKVAGVIGFGKIGSSIAAHLRQLHIGTVIVYDIKPEMLMLAASLDFSVGTKKTILDKCEVVFCATGNKSINAYDLQQFQHEKVYIASCTSSETEFDLLGIKCPEIKIKPSSNNPPPYHLYKFPIGKSPSKEGNKRVYMLAYGDAINFHYKAVVGPYIRAVQAGIIVASLQLILKLNKGNFDTKSQKLIELDVRDEEKVAQIWLETFHKNYLHDMIEHKDMPAKNLKFVCRDKDIEEIEKTLKLRDSDYAAFHYTRMVLNIFGAEGGGKTECLKEFIRENAKHYDLIQWIDFRSGSLGSQFKGFATKLNISISGKSENEIINDFILKLENTVNFALIFDDVNEDKFNIIKSFFKLVRISDNTKHSKPASGRCHIIFITKDKVDFTNELTDQTFNSLEINKFKPADSLIYIDKCLELYNSKNKSKKSINTIKKEKIAEACLNHTLILEKAIAYLLQSTPITDTDIEIDPFIDGIKTEDNNEKSILDKVMNKIYQAISSNHNDHILILSLTYLASKNITKSMIITLAKIIENTSNNIVDKLINYLLITLPQVKPEDEENCDNFTLVSMVKESLQKKVTADNVFLIVPALVKMLNQFFNYNYYLNNNTLNQDKTLFNITVSHVEEFFNKYDTLLDKISDETQKSYQEQLNKLFISYANYCLHEMRAFDSASKYADRVVSQFSLEQKHTTEEKLNYVEALIKKNICRISSFKNIEQTSSVSTALIEIKEKVEKDLNLAINTLEKMKFSENESLKFVCAKVETYITYSYLYKLLAEAKIESKTDFIEKSYNMLIEAKKTLNTKGDDNELDMIRAAYLHAEGGILIKWENFNGASESFRNCILLRKKVLDSHHPDLARSLYKSAETDYSYFTEEINKAGGDKADKIYLLRAAVDACYEAYNILTEAHFSNKENKDYQDVKKLKIKLDDYLKTLPPDLKIRITPIKIMPPRHLSYNQSSKAKRQLRLSPNNNEEEATEQKRQKITQESDSNQNNLERSPFRTNMEV